jgi:hypothetical protein
MSDLTDKQDAMEQILLNKLPHGSGIDCKWEFTWLVNGKCIASNSYHCINDAGYYDGYADFKVILHKPMEDAAEFSLQFIGREGQNKNRQYNLREYLQDILYYALRNETVACGGVV